MNYIKELLFELKNHPRRLSRNPMECLKEYPLKSFLIILFWFLVISALLSIIGSLLYLLVNSVNGEGMCGSCTMKKQWDEDKDQ